MTLEDARKMRQELEALGLAIIAKRQLLDERGLFDAQTRAAASDPQADQLAIAPNQEAINIDERRPHARSVIAKEIDALGERLRLWIARIDQKYQSNNMYTKHNRHRDLGPG